ncbi:MAG: hypothetical protein K9L64_06140 [Candidatus Izimaplasma sp.]|nr:hypothetical protein [Candidatus Izimaplasma bacterium]
MKKDMLLKVIKVGLLFLFAIGFLFTFITGNIMGLADYSYNAFQLEELNPDKSADVFIIIFFVIALAGSVVMFMKPEYERIANLAVLGLGLVLLVVLYLQVFNDSDLQGLVDLGAMTAKIGFGIVFQLIILVLGFVFEFKGDALIKE